MSVSSYLESMASNLIIGGDEDIKIDRSINHLRKNLERYFGEEVFSILFFKPLSCFFSIFEIRIAFKLFVTNTIIHHTFPHF